jgi:hypothetical protein
MTDFFALCSVASLLRQQPLLHAYTTNTIAVVAETNTLSTNLTNIHSKPNKSTLGHHTLLTILPLFTLFTTDFYTRQSHHCSLYLTLFTIDFQSPQCQDSLCDRPRLQLRIHDHCPISLRYTHLVSSGILTTKM